MEEISSSLDEVPAMENVPTHTENTSLYVVVTRLLTRLITTWWQPCYKVVTTLSPHCDDLGIETVARL